MSAHQGGYQRTYEETRRVMGHDGPTHDRVRWVFAETDGAIDVIAVCDRDAWASERIIYGCDVPPCPICEVRQGRERYMRLLSGDVAGVVADGCEVAP